MTRGLGLALLLCLAGAVLLLVGSSATWSTLVVPGAAPLPDTTRSVSGADLVPGLRALGIVGLAGVPALLAVRRLGRVLLGVLLALAGAAAVVLVVRVLADFAERVALVRDPGSAQAGDRSFTASSTFLEAPSPSLAAYGALLGGVLLLAAGVLTAVRGRSWAALGARYERPRESAAPAAPVGEKQVWDALDRGEDPTR